MHEFEVALGCDGGRKKGHPLRRLGMVVVRDELNHELELMGLDPHAAGSDVDALQARNRREGGRVRRERFTAVSVKPVAAGRLWIIRCPSCGREVRRQEADVLLVVRAAIATGVDGLLNIALWPC